MVTLENTVKYVKIEKLKRDTCGLEQDPANGQSAFQLNLKSNWVLRFEPELNRQHGFSRMFHDRLNFNVTYSVCD